MLPKFREIYGTDRYFAKQIPGFGANPTYIMLKRSKVCLTGAGMGRLRQEFSKLYNFFTEIHSGRDGSK